MDEHRESSDRLGRSRRLGAEHRPNERSAKTVDSDAKAVVRRFQGPGSPAAVSAVSPYRKCSSPNASANF